MNSHTIGTSNGTHVGKSKVREETQAFKERLQPALEAVSVLEFNRGYTKGFEAGEERSTIAKAEWCAVGFIGGLLAFAVVGLFFGMRFA